MPGQRQKGKKNARKNRAIQYELPEPTDKNLIAVVKKSQGGRPPRFVVNTIYGDEYVAPIQGSIARGPKRVLVKPGNYVLLIPFEDSVCGTNVSNESKTKYYINHVYTSDDVRTLDKKGFLKKKTLEETEEAEIVFETVNGGAGAGSDEEGSDGFEFDIDAI
jgi:hypothetical protein